MVTFLPAPPRFEPIHSISTAYNPASRAAVKVVSVSDLNVWMVTTDLPLKPSLLSLATNSSKGIRGSRTRKSLIALLIDFALFASLILTGGFTFLGVSVGVGVAVGFAMVVVSDFF